MNGETFGVLAATLLFASLTIIAIAFMRRTHPGEVYLIWYVISCALILFLGLDSIAQHKHVAATAICGSYESACQTVYGQFTDFEGEVQIIMAILIVAIIPQLVAYFFSALSGSASAPLFVSEVTTYAVWSLIKFSAAFAGIVLADATTKALFGKPITLRDFASAVFFVSTAFSFTLYATFRFESLEPALRNEIKFRLRHVIRLVGAVHLFATRNVPVSPPAETASYSIKRRALITLLESDAVYDYLTQNEKDT